MENEKTILQGNKTLITMGAMFAGLMAFVDISIVNVALNDIRSSFGTPLDQIVWVSTAYAMANITIIPLSGWLLKRYGFRKYYFLIFLMDGNALQTPREECGGGAARRRSS